MLHFSEFFSEHEETDLLIRREISNRLVGLLEDILHRCAVEDITKIPPDDERLSRMLRRYMPAWGTNRTSVELFRDLMRVLASAKTIDPDLAEEYMLHRILEERILMEELFDISSVARFREHHLIAARLRKHEPYLTSDEINGFLNRLEDLRYYEQFCFWDLDHELLGAECLFCGRECDDDEA